MSEKLVSFVFSCLIYRSLAWQKRPKVDFCLLQWQEEMGIYLPLFFFFACGLGGGGSPQQWKGEETPFLLHCKWARGRKVFCPMPPPLCGWRKRGWVQTVDDYPQGSYLNCFPCIANAKKNFHEIHTLLFPSLLHCSPYPEACLKDQKHPSLSLSFLFLFLIHLSQRSEEGDDDEGGQKSRGEIRQNLVENVALNFKKIFYV